MTFENIPPDLLHWPDFHNGVAAGLRISPQFKEANGSWILYNTPTTVSCTNAGFLYGLGLNGHLASVDKYSLFRFISQCHDLTTIGILLGLSAAKVGTMDPVANKMLVLHIPALLPPSSTNLPTPSIVQTAAMLGIGLLYQGTAHRRMTEVMLGEMERQKVHSFDSHTAFIERLVAVSFLV